MKKIVFLVFLLMFGLVTGFANAYSVNVGYDPGTTYVTTGLTGFSTTGSMMDGMAVTVVFSDGNSETEIWGDTSPTGGAAGNTAWGLEESGDTWDGNWNFSFWTTTDLFISRLIIDAGAGNSVFDVWNWDDPYPYPGTDGSASGVAFDVQAASDLDITATYKNQVALIGDAPVGDLYRDLIIDFGGNGFGPNDYLSFVTDTDSLLYAGDLKPVPEPSTFVLFGLGIIGLIGARKKFGKK